MINRRPPGKTREAFSSDAGCRIKAKSVTTKALKASTDYARRR
jgi:hypothetical protein